MTVEFQCPDCDHEFTSESDSEASVIACPMCGSEISSSKPAKDGGYFELDPDALGSEPAVRRTGKTENAVHRPRRHRPTEKKVGASPIVVAASAGIGVALVVLLGIAVYRFVTGAGGDAEAIAPELAGASSDGTLNEESDSGDGPESGSLDPKIAAEVNALLTPLKNEKPNVEPHSITSPFTPLDMAPIESGVLSGTASASDTDARDKPEDSQGASGTASETPGGVSRKSWADVNDLVEPSVVKVNVTTAQGNGNGSGFVVDSSGIAVTNYHVVAGGIRGSVEFVNGTTIGIDGYLHLDPQRDIALLKFDPTGFSGELRALPLSSTEPRKGEQVAAFGAPLGLDFTMTQSIVGAVRTTSDLEEAIGLSGHAGTWIQHSTPISPGNSGGPLVNQLGQVVAINTLTLTVGQNLNFAISAQDVRNAVDHQTQLVAMTPTNAPPVRRPELSIDEPPFSAVNPYERQDVTIVDVVGDDRATKAMAEMDKLGILLLAFTHDVRQTVTGFVRSEARKTVDRLNLRHLANEDSVMVLQLRLERRGITNTVWLNGSILTRDEGELLKVWEDDEEVGTIAQQALFNGVMPSTLRRDITRFFTKMRGDFADARRQHGNK